MTAWKSAIARITVGQIRGTGVLVSADGLVLTAFHVVADRKKSLEKKKPLFYAPQFEIAFGDPKTDKIWTSGDAVLVPGKYSMDEDWALLRVPLPLKADPLPLAPLEEPRQGRAFDTFGFPTHEKEIGGEYDGTLGAWDDWSVELGVPKIEVGMDMGGISGAPCLVAGRVVGLILQSLADERNLAVKASLYMRPIARAVRGCEGLVAWDHGTMTFQDEVTKKLPADTELLTMAAAKLGLPPQRADRSQIARGLLSSELTAAAAALGCCDLDEKRWRPILDHVAAMQLHEDAVDKIRQADRQSRLALLQSVEDQVRAWYVERAYYPRVRSRRVIVVPFAAGSEESPAAEWILGRIREFAEKQLGPDLVASAMSAEEKDVRRFWVILIDEARLDAVEAARKRLPNARIIVAWTGEREPPPDDQRALAIPIDPVINANEERDLLELWRWAAVDLAG